LAEAYPLASVAYAVTALPAEADSAAILAEMKKIISDYAAKGVPVELVDASKRGEIAAAEFERNSIPGLADSWSIALAANGRNSPDDDVNAIRGVTVADVNRVAKQYLVSQDAVVGILKPVPAGGPVSQKGFGGSEQLTSAPTKPVELPDWAAKHLATLEVPPAQPNPSDIKLPNGLRLIVKTVTLSPTITVAGSVKHEHNLETPTGKDGEAGLLEDLFSYGTKTLDRLAFQKALDDIAASENAGFDFSLRVLKSDFSRGVQLLADNELNPSLPADAFDIVKKQNADFVAGELQSPGYRSGRALAEGLLPPGDPARREVTPKSIGAVTLDDLRQYQAKTIRPDLTTIVVIGDVTPDEARSVIAQWFGGWKASGPAPEVDLASVAANKASAVRVPDPSELQDNVTLAEEVELNRFSPDYYALQLGTHVLGGGFYATRLYHDLRQVTGYVYTVDVSFAASKTRATYSVSYACDPVNSEKAQALIVRDLQDMQTHDVTPAELQQAKALLLRQIPLRESSEDSVAEGYLGRAEINLTLDEPLVAAQRYYDMTAEQVRVAFQKWLRPDGFVWVTRGPAVN
jgi:zinc protease